MPNYDPTTAALRFDVDAAEALYDLANADVRTIQSEVGRAVLLSHMDSAGSGDVDLSGYSERYEDAHGRVMYYAEALGAAEGRLSAHLAREVEAWAGVER